MHWFNRRLLIQVGWLQRETDRAARIEDFVATLKQLHEDFDWPKPSLDLGLHRRQSGKRYLLSFSLINTYQFA